jgi:hypothetical protein
MKAELPTKGIDNEHSSDATNQNHYNGENCWPTKATGKDVIVIAAGTGLIRGEHQTV